MIETIVSVEDHIVDVLIEKENRECLGAFGNFAMNVKSIENASFDKAGWRLSFLPYGWVRQGGEDKDIDWLKVWKILMLRIAKQYVVLFDEGAEEEELRQAQWKATFFEGLANEYRDALDKLGAQDEE